MRRLLATAAASMLLLTAGCAVEVEEEGADPLHEIGAETQWGDLGFDPDDCFPEVVVPEEGFEEDFGVYQKTVAPAQPGFDGAVVLRPVERDKDQAEDSKDAYEDPCEASGMCHWTTQPPR